MANFNWPILQTTAGPIQFLLDSVATDVSEDTGTPANSVPLPVKFPVPPTVIPDEPVNTSSYDEITNLVDSAQTLTAPANAVGFKILAPSTNDANIRWKIGAAATTTSGFLMEPGRSEDFEVGEDISVISTTTAVQTVIIQWVIKP